MNTILENCVDFAYASENAVDGVAALIAERVCQCLRQELKTFPKPGLVSFVDQGSHPDMNAAVFLRAIETLRPCFESLAQAGRQLADFGELQKIGIQAEAAMLQDTDNRNTHRGALFSLGLLAAAAGVRSVGRKSDTFLGEIVRTLWAPSIRPPYLLTTNSHGIAACRQYHVSGARGEAMRGFSSVYQCGLPVYRRYLKLTDANSARVQTFCELFMVCEDTTTLHRGGMAGFRFARSQVGAFLKRGGVLSEDWLDSATGIHQSFVERNLTAGGTADLLAATLFVYSMEPDHE